MTTEVVFKLAGLSNDKVKRKAMSTAYSLPGVESIAVDMKVQNNFTVTGDSFDVIQLAAALRRSCGYIELVSVGPAKVEPESKKSSSR